MIRGLQAAARLRRTVLDTAARRRHPALHRALREAKAEQASAWEELAPRAAAVHARLARAAAGPDTSVTTLWRGYAATLEAQLLPSPPMDFLRLATIQETMALVRGGGMLAHELAFLSAHVPEPRLRADLEEDLAGDPALQATAYACSHTLVHHLHHLERHRAATGADWRAMASVVEWGGGFGSLARLLRRSCDAPPTHVVVDLPISLTLQWTYLATIFGEDAVAVVDDPASGLRDGSVNLVPTAVARRMDLRAELFVSTWGLSEASRAEQERVAAGGWFGAPHLLVAFQRAAAALPESERVGELVRAGGGRLEPADPVRGSVYALR